MAVNLSPIGNGAQFFDATGRVLAGGLINTYIAGTSTPQTTYTTTLGSIPNSNPIVLGADGRPPSEIWLTSPIAYKFVLTDSLSNVIATYDDIKGINDLNNVSIAGTLAVAGNTTLTNLTVTGNTTIGDGSGDGLSILPSVVVWSGNPTHVGAQTFNNTVTCTAGLTVNTVPATIDTANVTTLAVSGNETIGGTLTITGVVTQNANPAGKTVGNTYTPTLTAVSNISSTTPATCFYIRMGPVVSVSGSFSATSTAAGTCQLGLTLPIASTLTLASNLAGPVGNGSAFSFGPTVQGDTVNNRALFVWNATAATSFQFGFEFKYVVI